MLNNYTTTRFRRYISWSKKMPPIISKGPLRAAIKRFVQLFVPYAATPGLEFAITDFCNLTCQHCSQASPIQENRARMSYEDIERIANLLRPDEFKIIKISGGEPTMHPDFKKICENLRDLFPDREFHLATNGAKLKRYLDCIDVFDVVDLSHYPELNDEVYSVLKTDIQQRGLTNVRFYDKWDYGQTDDAYQMTNVFSEKNLNKTDIFSHCSHRGGGKNSTGPDFPLLQCFWTNGTKEGADGKCIRRDGCRLAAKNYHCRYGTPLPKVLY